MSDLLFKIRSLHRNKTPDPHTRLSAVTVVVTVKVHLAQKVHAGIKPKKVAWEYGRGRGLNGSANDVAPVDASRAPWVEPRWNTRRWKGKWWFVIKTFQRKADAKGPIYACNNFTPIAPPCTLTHSSSSYQTPHKLQLQRCDEMQK